MLYWNVITWNPHGTTWAPYGLQEGARGVARARDGGGGDGRMHGCIEEIVFVHVYSVNSSSDLIARSYLLESARSHQHSEAKQEWAGLVLA